MAKYQHTVVNSGDTLLADSWNQLGLKVQSLNQKFDEEQNLLSSPLQIQGALSLDSSEVYFTDAAHNHSSKGNAPGHAAIENAANYSALMILGRNLGDTKNINRQVVAYDDLTVSRNLTVNSNLTTRNDLSVLRNASVRGLLKVGRLEVDVTPSVVIKAYDFSFGHPSRKGGTGRALVDSGKELTINYNADWQSGVNVDSILRVSGATTLSSSLTVAGSTTLKGALSISTASDYGLAIQTTDDRWNLIRMNDRNGNIRARLGLDSQIDDFEIRLYGNTKNLRLYATHTYLQNNTSVVGSLSVSSSLSVSGDITANRINANEIRSKIWNSGEYTLTVTVAKRTMSVRMGPSSTTIPIITHIQGKFNGTGEWTRVRSSGGYWILEGYTHVPNLVVKARCIGKPF